MPTTADHFVTAAKCREAALVSARLHPDEDTRHAAEVLAETVPGIEPEGAA
jgi:hypothetical protein